MAVTGLPCRFRVRSLSDGGQVAPRRGRHTPSPRLACGAPECAPGARRREALHRPRRHCERSEAIHRATVRKHGLLRGACHRARIRATRWLAMTTKHTLATSPRHAPEPLKNLPPKEGVGNAGCPWHPRPRVHLVVVERTRVTTSTPESPDVPARNGFNGFLRALPGDRALLPPSPCGLKVLSSPVEPNEPPQDLTPASRRQDHT